MRTRGKGGGGGRGGGKGEGGGGETRGNTITSQGKLEVNGRWTPKGLADKDNSNEAQQTGRTLSTNVVEPCLKSLNEIVRAIRGMKGSSYEKGGARELATEPHPHLAHLPLIQFVRAGTQAELHAREEVSPVL